MFPRGKPLESANYCRAFVEAKVWARLDAVGGQQASGLRDFAWGGEATWQS